MDTTFLDDYFYCFTWEDRPTWIHEGIPRILVFSIQDAEEMQMRQMWVEPLSELFVEDDRQMYALISCGSRLLMVSLKDEPNGLVIIWEFYKVSRGGVDITTQTSIKQKHAQHTARLQYADSGLELHSE